MNEQNQIIPNRSYETQAIKERIETLKQGDILRYSELDTIVKGDSRNGKRHHVSSARRICLNESSIVLRCVAGIGYERIDGPDVTHKAAGTIAHVRRVTRTAKRELAAVDYDKLSEGQRIQWSCRAAQCALMHHHGSSKSARRLSAGLVPAAQAKLPSAADALKAMQEVMAKKD